MARLSGTHNGGTSFLFSGTDSSGMMAQFKKGYTRTHRSLFFHGCCTSTETISRFRDRIDVFDSRY